MATSPAEFLEAIDIVRDSYGSCTYEALAQQLGVSRNAAYTRVQRLVRDGHVTVSELPGSIRRAPSEATA